LTGPRAVATACNGTPSSAVPARVLHLRFTRAPDGCTFIGHQHAPYPFHIGKALRLSGDPPEMATVYVQSCSGGLYEAERLRLDIDVGPQAMACVTTQASTIVHSMTAGSVAQSTAIRVDPGGMLEYLPDPLILFPEARIAADTTVVIADDAQAIFSESFLAHDPQGHGRPFGSFSSALRIEDRAGRLLACDRFNIEGDRFAAMSAAGESAYGAHGTMTLLADADHNARGLDLVRRRMANDRSRFGDTYAGASLLPGRRGVWLRLLARDGVALRRLMTVAWMALRETLTGRLPEARRK
jgi:urease accessory protein